MAHCLSKCSNLCLSHQTPLAQLLTLANSNMCVFLSLCHQTPSLRYSVRPSQASTSLPNPLTTICPITLLSLGHSFRPARSTTSLPNPLTPIKLSNSPSPTAKLLSTHIYTYLAHNIVTWNSILLLCRYGHKHQSHSLLSHPPIRVPLLQTSQPVPKLGRVFKNWVQLHNP